MEPTARTGFPVGAWVATALLLPGILLLLPGGPLPEGNARAGQLFLLAAVAARTLPGSIAVPRPALVLTGLALLTGWGLWTHLSLSTEVWWDRPVGRGLTFLLTALWIPLVAVHLFDRRRARTSLAALGISAAVAGAWVVLDRALGRAPVGPFGRTGVTGPLLASLIPCLAVLDARRFATRGPVLRAVPWVVATAGLLATGSRTAWAAAAVGVLVWAGARAASAAGARRALLAAGGLVAAGVLLVALSVSGVLPGGSWVGRSDTIAVRLGLWRASARLAAEAPIAGHGQGAFPTVILEQRDLEEARLSRGRRPLEAHSDVAHQAVEGGLPAALALVLLAGGALLLAWRGARASEGADRAMLAACAGGLAALAAAAIAENPFLEPPTAAVFAVLAGTAAAFRTGEARPARTPVARRILLGVVGLVFSVLLFRTSIADVQVARDDWDVARESDADFIPLERDDLASLAPGVRLVGAHPAGLYRLATLLARGGQFEDARRFFGEQLRSDSGATEARLDIAETWRIEGRADLAREALLEAGRHDPTRVDVPLRLGHLALGPEEPPSRQVPPADPLAILRHYNDAAALAPDRFEVDVAYARVHRRRGDAKAAGAALRDAQGKAARLSRGIPGEILLESFRLAEAEGDASRAATGILGLALEASPLSVAADIRREADACALAADTAGRAGPADPRASRADFDAARRRYAALALTRRGDLTGIRALARARTQAGQDRAALAAYLGLLADPFAAPDTDLVLEARAVASRVDREIAEALAARGRALLGFEALSKGDAVAAETQFRIAISKDPGGAAAHFGLAKALVRQRRREEAAVALAKALAADPTVADRAATDPDLSDLR
ncbi:MAG TPA: O-antigen ligase family protein [Planctomycetota bacterium]|nr:O-antigen ligase family protein [Planctomycetota bacterium]